MSQAESLLNSTAYGNSSLYTTNSILEEHIVIDNNRFISVPDALKRIAVQYDHNVETVTFDCPRYWDNHDLSTMYIYINYLRSDRIRGQYLAKNITVDESNPNMIHFDWTIGSEISFAKGALSFLVCAVETDSEGNEQHHWNSEINDEMYISDGLECGEVIINQHPDIITDLLTRMDSIMAADSPILDTTLSQSGFAADAKMVGDAINTEKTERENADNELLNTINVELNKKPFYFDNVASMKASNLKIGDCVITIGYYSANDGGRAEYIVRTKTSSDIEDGGMIHFINDTLVAELISRSVNCKMFGAIDSQTEDQSTRIINAINYCVNKGIMELQLNGQYFVNNIMTFTNINNLKISNGTLYVHENDALLTSGYNIFMFENSSNIILDSIKVIELNPITRVRHLQTGGFIFSECDNCIISNCYLENVNSGIMLISGSKNSIIENNVIKTTYQSEQFAQSAILNYSASNNKISNNKIYGEYYDGALSVFGGGTKDVIIDGNELYNIIDGVTPISLSQGITIDQGPDNTIVINNIICDMYYGIDNKSDTINTKITNNILIGNKISIANRQGENSSVGDTLGCVINDNKIIIQKNYDTNNLATYLHYDLYYYVGILIGIQSSSIVKNNDITLNGAIDKPVLGIDIKHKGSTNQYTNVLDVSGNNIEFSTGYGSSASNAPTNSVGIVIYDCKKGKFVGNTFKVDTTSNTYKMFELRMTNTNLLISDNLFYATSNMNHHFIYFYDNDSTLTYSTVTDNHLNKCKPLQTLESITNKCMFENKLVRRSKTLALTTDYLDVCKYNSTSAGGFLIKLEALGSGNGLKCLDCCYTVYVSGITVKVTEVYNNNIGLAIQFVNDGNNNAVKMQIKSEVSFNIKGIDIVDFRSYGTFTLTEL